jgi:5-methylcytosine-specific restriction protein A
MSPKRFCSERCRKAAENERAKKRKQMTKAWNHGDRESPHKRRLGREHRKARADLLAGEPLCRLCKQKSPPRVTPATIADHVIPRAKGGSGDISNLQPVCAACHDEKTRLDLGWRPRRKRIDISGWPIDE